MLFRCRFVCIPVGLYPPGQREPLSLSRIGALSGSQLHVVPRPRAGNLPDALVYVASPFTGLTTRGYESHWLRCALCFKASISGLSGPPFYAPVNKTFARTAGELGC